MESNASAESEVKAYFQKPYCQRLGQNPQDEVRPLVYSNRGNAVRELKEQFLQLPENQTLLKNDKRLIGNELCENFDYQSLRQNPQRGAASPTDYMLSVSCMEFNHLIVLLWKN